MASFSIFGRCRALAAKFLSEKNGDSQHTIHAMGHCHIDSGASYCFIHLLKITVALPFSQLEELITLMWNVYKGICIIYPAMQLGCGPTQSPSGSVLAAGPLWWP